MNEQLSFLNGTVRSVLVNIIAAMPAVEPADQLVFISESLDSFGNQPELSSDLIACPVECNQTEGSVSAGKRLTDLLSTFNLPHEILDALVPETFYSHSDDDQLIVLVEKLENEANRIDLTRAGTELEASYLPVRVKFEYIFAISVL